MRQFSVYGCMYMYVQAMEEVGTVQTILDSGDVRVRFPSNKTWTLNSDAIAKVLTCTCMLLHVCSMINNVQPLLLSK